MLLRDAMAESFADIRNDIIASSFRKVNEDGVIDETYVAHAKIWEDVPAGTDVLREENGMKPRYIISAGTLNKASGEYVLTLGVA